MNAKLENTGIDQRSFEILPRISKMQSADQQTQVEFNKVLVVGLGQIGLPVAKYVKEKGYDAYGYDISSKAMNIAEGASIKKANNFSEFDVYILSSTTGITIIACASAKIAITLTINKDNKERREIISFHS